MGTKSEVMAKSAIADSLWTQYGSFVGQKLKNAGVSINPREDDLKKVKEWMEKTKKPAEFLLSFDGTWLTLEVRVGSNKDTMTQFNTAAENDRGKRRATLEKLSKITSVVTQADLDAFDKANPDPTELAN